MSTHQKGFAGTVLVLLVVVLVLAIVLGYVTLVKKPTSVEQPQTNNSVPKISQSNSETTDWKTFNSIKDGKYRSGYFFTLRYPPMWYFENHSLKQGYADDQDTQFSDYALSRGEEGILLKPIPRENCAVFISVDYTKSPKQPNFTSNNSYSNSAKKAACNSVIQQIKESLSAEFTIQ